MGKVQLYRISPEGKKLVITTLGPHTLFGEMALLGTKLHNTFAEAIEDCMICVMSRNDLERLILGKPQVALRILEITGRRLRDAESGWRTWPSRAFRRAWPACCCAWPKSRAATTSPA
jgi:CRP/FNR family cyclic AMP-dependent transcriptional regulator